VLVLAMQLPLLAVFPMLVMLLVLRTAEELPFLLVVFPARDEISTVSQAESWLRTRHSTAAFRWESLDKSRIQLSRDSFLYNALLTQASAFAASPTS
jgi:hypothetical protein